MKTLNNYIFYISSLLLLSCNGKMDFEIPLLDRQPDIFPDYKGITIPANIAPLNFVIQEKADKYFVEIASKKGNPLTLRQSSPIICFPQRKWHKILHNNKGETLTISVGIKSQGKWKRFVPITDTIANESIDRYLTYRLITGYVYWRDMRIVQRNLENFHETYIFRNSSTDMACANCHSFCLNDHTKMSMHIRRKHSGTIIVDGQNIKKINTKTSKSISPGAYTSWHPSGKFIAFSNNNLGLDFTTHPKRPLIVSDYRSDIVFYNIEKNVVIPCTSLITKNRENLPNWSPDGKWLYFISTGPLTNILEDIYMRYSLCRIPFDVNSHTFGKVDTLISANEIEKSTSFPIASPDGKYILFCMTDYGYFTIWDEKSDLYLYEIASRRYWPLACNSKSVESSHSWSHNSRWFVFASKRMDDFYTRLYISYLDTSGRAHKPFVLSQSDPDKYQTYMVNYNLPELVDGKISISEQKIRDVVLEELIDARSAATNTGSLPGEKKMELKPGMH